MGSFISGAIVGIGFTLAGIGFTDKRFWIITASFCIGQICEEILK